MADNVIDTNKQNAHVTKKKKEAFTIDFGDGCKSNLQESFIKFKKARQKEIAKQKKVRKARLKRQKNPKFQQELRRKFINQAKKYFGIPYARKYWTKDTEEYHSKLFLDCCGLVRQVVRDLAKDFGFVIGPWNQAYMYDTLPHTIKEEEMKAGDLVFMSGTYVNPKSTNQKHFMTHVEIWLGEGPKTIGARWNNGKVQIWDNYQFNAKSFTNTQYHFKSIDTWLKGICKSYCPVHKWKRSKFKPGKKSIFRQDKENNEKDKQTTQGTNDQSNNRQEQDGEPADEVVDEPDDDPDNDPDDDQEQDEEDDDLDDEDQDEDDDLQVDDDVDDFEQNKSGLDDNSDDTGLTSGGMSSSSLERDFSQNSLVTIDTITNGNSPRKQITGNKQKLEQSETSLLVLGDRNRVSCSEQLIQNGNGEHCIGPRQGPSMKAGCDVTNKSSGDECTQTVTNDLANQFRTTSIQGCPSRKYSFSETNNEGVHENSVKETEEKSPTKRGKKSPGMRHTKLPQCSLPTNMQPTFYIGGGNGVSLVEGPLLALGWKRTPDKYDEKYRLKWVECKTRINYGGFKEGEQLVNHIPNGQLLTNKLGLLNSLQEYERVTLSTKGRPPRLKFSDFFPETYRLDEKNNKDAFLEVYQDGEMWICKPTGLNQGKGIFIIRSRDEINKLLEEREQRREQMSRSTKPLMTRIVQRYIMNPLLLNGKKFDVRAYMLVASTVPFLVLYQKGYVRLCFTKYDNDDQNLMTHLTNQYVQKKDPNFKDMKEETVWSMEKFNDYFNEKIAPKAEVEQDWVKITMTKQMQKIMIHCFNSVKHKLNQRIGYFDLFGLDFMVDTDLKVWLIEVNVNPSLSVACSAQKDVVPGVVEETLYLSIECFEKTRKNQPLLPLNTLKNFSVLYCGTRANTIPPRAPRSVSPTKEEKSKNSTLSAHTTASKNRSSVDQGRMSHRMSVSSTPLVSTGVKKSEDTSSNATNKSGESSKVTAADLPQSQNESVPLKMTHVSSADTSGANRGNENGDSEASKEPKSLWTLNSDGVLTLQAPSPVTPAPAPNLDQIKSILAQIGTPSSSSTQQTVASSDKPTTSMSSAIVSLTKPEVSLTNVAVTKTEQASTNVIAQPVVSSSEIVNSQNKGGGIENSLKNNVSDTKEKSTGLPRSEFPSLLAKVDTTKSTANTTLTTSTKSSSVIPSSASSTTSQSAMAHRSVPITTFSMSSVTGGHTSAQHERDRAETMAAYTTFSKLSSNNLPSISHSNSLVKSGNQNTRVSNMYKTTTNQESASLKFTSAGHSKHSNDSRIEIIPHRQSNQQQENQIEIIPHRPSRLSGDTQVEGASHRKHREYFERGS